MTPDNSAEARRTPVIQADREAAEQWDGIINHRDSEYEGDALADLATDFAKHRLTFSAEQNTGGMPGLSIDADKWRTGRDMPKVSDRHRDAAAWALDRVPDSQTWDSLTASHVGPDRLWQAHRVAEAFARFERDLLSLAATGGTGAEAMREAAAKVADAECQNAEAISNIAETGREEYLATGGTNAARLIAAAIRALPLSPTGDSSRG